MSKKFTYYGGIQTSLLPYLTAYWTADNIATDVYVNNLGGSLQFGAGYSAGKNNECFDFNLTSDDRNSVLVPYNPLLTPTNGVNDVPFTWRFWVKFDGLNTTNNFLLDKYTSGRREYLFIMRGSSVNLEFWKSSYGGNNRVETLANFTPNLNQWYHFAVTSDGNKFGEKIYVNGIDITSSQIEVGTYVRMQDMVEDLAFGTFKSNPNNRKHLGQMDEIAWFNGYEMTPSEVLTDYNLGIGKFYPNI